MLHFSTNGSIAYIFTNIHIMHPILFIVMVMYVFACVYVVHMPMLTLFSFRMCASIHRDSI